MNVSSCDNYYWTLTGKTYTVSGVYKDTIPNYAGCDSAVSLNLTIKKTSSASLNVSACEKYFWNLTGKTYTTSGVNKDTIPNYAGCDSVVTLNLTIKKSSSASLNVSACDNYYWTFAGKTYTASGVYKDTIPNYAGCDSVVTLNLTIHKSSSSSLNVSACENYYWNLTGKTYTTSGVYKDTISNYAGCDSVVTLNLTIKKASSANLNVSACDHYYWNLTGKTYTISGVYKDTIPNYAGCDSVVTLNLTIKKASSASLNVSACENYYWNLTGKIYTTSGVYKDTIPNYAGCDSIITLNLDIIKTDTTVSLTGNVLTAKESGIKYQWLNCENNYAVIPAETNQSFTPVKNGSYAVELKKSICSDTSSCYLVNSIGMAELLTGKHFLIYPNPTDQMLNIANLPNNFMGTVSLYNTMGQLLYSEKKTGSQFSMEVSHFKTGIYLIQIKTENDQIVTRKFIKE